MVRCAHLFVGFLVELFEIVSLFVILALELDVEAAHVVDEEIAEDCVHFVHSNFCESIFENQFDVLDRLRLLVIGVSLEILPELVGLIGEVLTLLVKKSYLFFRDFLNLGGIEWLLFLC